MGPLHEPCLVIGARGMLGTDLVQVLEEAGISFVAMDVEEVDIGDTESVARAFAVAEPGTVINVAAITDVDGCEAIAEQALRVNALGPENLASACRDRDCLLIHVSTDYVFDGHKRVPYQVDDPMNPLGMYGRSKAEGEKLIRRVPGVKSCIVRTQWLYGLHGKNFVATILNLAAKQDLIKVVDDQHGSPTYTRDLAGALVELGRMGAEGIFHVTNAGVTTWYGFAQRILERAGLGSVQVEPITTKELARPAPRPLYGVLDNRRFAALAGRCLRRWEEALDDYLRSRETARS